MSALEKTAAALALCFAAAANAQTPAPAPAPGPWPSAQQQRNAAKSAQQAQPAAQSRLTQQQQQALGAVWYYGQLHAAVGDAAAKRGSSPNVKKFGTGIQKWQKNAFLPKLATLLQARGTNPASLPQPPDAQQLDQEAKALQARSGADFDSGFQNFWKQHGEAFVNALKSAREATPGSDPELKKTLDDAKESGQSYLTELRQYGVQAQGRTPPAR